ncbi:carnosine synthase 1 isoform X4 [Pteropus alecto]|uniref:carnosine synthase 1 isoform X4 n=1 Tax=Pteropus alecto TaxID=9402 RepID=UPI0007688160|nr:carnosine synthase 1 isoform X4 [Pteropus alecto]
MLSLDPLGLEWPCSLGSKDLEEEEGPWGGGSGPPPPGYFPGSWRQDVGLDCKGCPEGAEARAWTVYYYSLLQSCLQQAGLPETQDRSQVPRTGFPGAEVTLCILGSPSTFLSVLLEAGVQSPGNMLLCLSPAWLTKVPAPGQPGEAALLVSKAVSFHPGGLTFLDDFVPPRRATYFLAGLRPGSGWGREAAELARDLTCPTGATAELARLLEDRLLTRQLLAQQGGVAVPATLAFTYKPPALLQGGEASPGLRLVELSGKEGQETLVKEEVGAFLHSEALGDALQVAIKLSSWRWRGRQALRLRPRAEVGMVADTVLALLEKLEEEESVVVEAVCLPARMPFPGSPPPGPELAVRICAVVCRTQGDRPLLSKLHLVESDPNHFASQLVQTFIHFDVTEHRKDEENARLLAELVRARGLQLDGCFSYWDDCLVLTALLCQELGLPCSPPAAMRLAKQKSRTQLHLLCRQGPPWPSPSLHAVPCCSLESEADVERAVRQVPLPGVMKLEFGAGAVGVRLVEDAPQCHEHFSRIVRDLQGEADHPGIGLGWGNAMLLMEFVEGTEHDVDLVVFGGQLLAAFVSDNGPTRLPGFTETAACMPTGLAPEQEAQLVQAAFRCCLGCGLLDGVFNVELKLTRAGPRLIEINPRMGGFYLRDWILELYGVDLLLAAAMVACRLRPALPAHARARGHLVGVMCLVSQHLQVLSSTASQEALQALHDGGLLRFNVFLSLEEALVPSEYEEPYCNVACAGSSPAEARLRLLGLCQGLGIDGPHYPVAHFLSHFK